MRTSQLFWPAVVAAIGIETPKQIEAYGTVVLKRWCRGDDVTLSAGKVAQWNDKSGSGNHGIGTSPRQPLWLADGGNGKPALQFLGDIEPGTGNRDELRWPGYARPAPGTTNNFQIIILRKDGDEIGSNRMVVADSAASAFQIKRPSTTSVDLVMVNSASNANTNANLPNDTIAALEAVFANSLDTYLKIRGVTSNGSFAGNNSGTDASMGVTQAATGWMSETVFELIDFWGQPNMLQLSKLGAYIFDRYGLVL